MNSLPTLTLLEASQVSPPPGTVGNRSLPLTFFDIQWLTFPPVTILFFYELPMITQTHFTQTIVPNLKKSLSITLQHFFPYAGNLIVFNSPASKPEIRYVEGDSACKVTFAESNLDFNDLTGNHPRDCDKFYHLIPPLTRTTKVSDFITIPVFSVQVTLFPNSGFSMSTTTHHCLADASTAFSFLNAWALIARSGCYTDELFQNLPIYERVVYPKLDETYLKNAKLETFFKDQEYQPPTLSGPVDKVRATLTLTRKVINELKKFVSAKLPTLPYVSSFTVACAYIWSCIAGSRKNNELEQFIVPIDCRARLNPPIPTAYLGNCVAICFVLEKTSLLTGEEGFINAAKLLGENLHKMLTDKDGIVKYFDQYHLVSKLEPMPTLKMAVAGTPKVRFYDVDFGWGKPKKHELVSTDYRGSISMNAGKEPNEEDLEIGVCLSPTEMETFACIFHHGLPMKASLAGLRHWIYTHVGCRL